MEKIGVLIVDDQDLFAKGLELVLLGEGKGEIQVLGIAGNGEEAIEMTGELRPDIILMDIRMPKMDGVRATEIIMQEYPATRILILTTFDDDEYAYNALSAGARGFVLKNVPPHELVLSIRALKNDALYVSSSVGFKVVNMMRMGNRRIQVEKGLIDSILSHMPGLTLREAEVLTYVVRGKRNTEISEKLYISEKTVKNHISAIYEKLSIHNRLQVIAYVNDLLKRPEQ